MDGRRPETKIRDDLNATLLAMAADRQFALRSLNEIEIDMREQAIGSQDGYLLEMANRMRKALNQFST